MTNEELIAEARKQHGYSGLELDLADALEAEIARRKSAEANEARLRDALAEVAAEALVRPNATEGMRRVRIIAMSVLETAYPEDSA